MPFQIEGGKLLIAQSGPQGSSSVINIQTACRIHHTSNTQLLLPRRHCLPGCKGRLSNMVFAWNCAVSCCIAPGQHSKSAAQTPSLGMTDPVHVAAVLYSQLQRCVQP